MQDHPMQGSSCTAARLAKAAKNRMNFAGINCYSPLGPSIIQNHYNRESWGYRTTAITGQWH
jgi:hypothetical protein